MSEKIGNVKKLRTIIERLLLAGRIPFIQAPAGVGKSSIIQQILEDVNDIDAIRKARELGEYHFGARFREVFNIPDDVQMQFGFFSAAHHDAQDLSAYIYSFERDELIHVVPNNFPTENAIIFIDEITNANRDFQKYLLQLFADKRVEDIVLRNVHFITAGNAPEHSVLAGVLPKPLLERVIVIEWAGPDVEEWIQNYPVWLKSELKKSHGHVSNFDELYKKFLEYAPSEVFTFLALQPGYFLQDTEDKGSYEPKGNPRKWSYVSIYAAMRAMETGEFNPAKDKIDKEILIGAVGYEAGQALTRFLAERAAFITPTDYISRGMPELSPEQEVFLRITMTNEVQYAIHSIIAEHRYETDTFYRIATGTDQAAADEIVRHFMERPEIERMVRIISEGNLSDRVLTLSYINRSLRQGRIDEWMAWKAFLIAVNKRDDFGKFNEVLSKSAHFASEVSKNIKRI